MNSRRRRTCQKGKAVNSKFAIREANVLYRETIGEAWEAHLLLVPYSKLVAHAMRLVADQLIFRGTHTALVGV
jgi:hypothetical protein